MTKTPRVISGINLSKLLRKYGYDITRQTGSHLRLTTNINGSHHITIPNHKFLKVGTLSSILNDISSHLEIEKSQLLNELFN